MNLQFIYVPSPFSGAYVSKAITLTNMAVRYSCSDVGLFTYCRFRSNSTRGILVLYAVYTSGPKLINEF